MDDYSRREFRFRHRLPLKDDHRPQLRTVSEAGQNDGEMRLLLASSTNEDGLLAAPVDGPVTRHVEAHRCLVHVPYLA